MRRLLKVLAAIGTVAWLGPAGAQSPSGMERASLLIDLSENLIGISTGFTGTDVLLFGTTDGVGDVVVEVRAPESEVVVRAKERVAGIWMNTESVDFASVPGYYHLAASKPPGELLPPETLTAERIGIENLHFSPDEDEASAQVAEFRSALIRNRQRSALFYEEPGVVTFQENRLFRTRVAFPSNVPTGRYEVTVFLVSGERIISRSTTDLLVRKIGLEAQLTEFAYQQAPVYGLIAVSIALITGWFAGFIFRKV